MPTPSLFCFGLGYTGTRLARAALAQGWRVAGTCRGAEKAEALRALNIQAIPFDGERTSPELKDALAHRDEAPLPHPSPEPTSKEQDAMFIAMNRFRINHGFEPDFERLWRERESYLSELNGFIAFRLLKGPDDGECTLYASHTTWASRADFEAWTQSEHFRKAHAQAKTPKGTYGSPNLRGLRCPAGGAERCLLNDRHNRAPPGVR